MAGEWLKLSTALAGQKLGIKEVDEGIWVVSLMQYDLGYFDLEQKTLQPSTARSPRDCHPCLRYGPLPMCPGWTIYEVAEREGFEPPIGLHLCRISSAVHSTTLPPLQVP